MGIWAVIAAGAGLAGILKYLLGFGILTYVAAISTTKLIIIIISIIFAVMLFKRVLR